MSGPFGPTGSASQQLLLGRHSDERVHMSFNPSMKGPLHAPEKSPTIAVHSSSGWQNSVSCATVSCGLLTNTQRTRPGVPTPPSLGVMAPSLPPSVGPPASDASAGDPASVGPESPPPLSSPG
jgi:hypothetical protein